MSKINRLIKNTLIFGVSNFASKILVFLLLPLYTRVMTTADFGSGDLILSIITLFIPIFTLCVAEGTLRFSLSKDKDTKAVFTYGISIILMGFLLILSFSPLLSKIPELNGLLGLFYLIYLATSLNSYFNNFLRGINRIKLIGFVGVLSTVVLISANIIFLVIFKMGLEGYLLSYLLMNLISTIVLFVSGKLRSYISFKKIDRNLISEINAFNIPLIPNRISWIIISTFNKYSLSFFWGASYLGILSAANKIPSFITAVYGIIQQALFLVVIEEYEDSNEITIFSQTYQILNLLLLFSVLLVNAAIKPTAVLLFSEHFYEAYKIAPLMVFSAFFGSLHGNLTTYFSAIKNTKVLSFNSMIGMLLMIMLSIVLVPQFGLVGAGISSVVVYFIMWIRLFNKIKNVVALDSNFSNDLACYMLLFVHWFVIIYIESFYYYIITVLIFIMVFLLKKKMIKLVYELFLMKIKELPYYIIRRKSK